MTYSVSARGKKPDTTITSWLYNYRIPMSDMDSVFGFPDVPCPFYGGRNFYVNPWETRARVVEITEKDIRDMYLKGIGLRLPLTNHYASREEYDGKMGRLVLEKYQRFGNSVIVVNDDLARWIKEDYPLFRIEASVIKGLNTHDKILRALELYDSVVPDFSVHEDLDFLADRRLPRARVRLFSNVSCERTCPARICYAFFSKVNKNPRDTSDLGPSCSREVERLAEKRSPSGGIHFYPVDKYKEMGYFRFKALMEDPARLGQAF